MLPAPKKKPDPTIEDVLQLHKKGDWEGAIDASRRALALPEYWFPDDRADLLCTQADALLELWRNEEAVRAAAECCGIIEKAWGGPVEKWSVRTTLVLAKARVRMGNFVEAGQVLDELEKRFPKAARRTEFLDLRAILDAASGFEVRVDYAGKFEGRPEIAEEYERLRLALPRALDQLERRLGRPRSSLPPVRVVLRDFSGDGIDYDMTGGTRGRGDRTMGLVRVNARFYVFGQGGEASSLAHELTHVLRFPADEGVKLPFWMDEGIAHWVEEESEARLWDRVITWSWESGTGLDLAPIRVALASPESWESRPTRLQRILSRLVFRHVERTRGTETARRLVQLLLDCRAFPAGCFWSVVLLGPDELAREAATAFPAWSLKALPGLEDIPDFYRLLESARPTELLNWVEEFVGRNPGSPLCAPVVCDALRRMTREKRADHADRLLGTLRMVVKGDTSWTFSLLREEFRLALVKRDLPAARSLRKELGSVAMRLTESKQEEHRKEFDEALASCEKAVAAANAGAPPNGSGSK